MKKAAKFVLAAVLAVALALGIVGCTNATVTGDFVVNEDGSGSRSFSTTLDTVDKEDTYGSSYGYLRIHGTALQTWIENFYNFDWLTVEVEDRTEADVTYETITISFEFADFDEYVSRIASLVAADSTKLPDDYTAPAYTTPTFTVADGIATLNEAENVTTAVYTTLYTGISADESAFDITCGEKNTSGTDIAGMLSGGAFKLGTVNVTLCDATRTVDLSGGPISLQANTDGSGFVFAREPAELVINYTFEDSTANTGTGGATYDLSLGDGSTMTAVEYVEGVNGGKAVRFDGSSYLKSKDEASFREQELTISFYYKADAWTETDTGANMVIVPDYLDALGAGQIDVEFFADPTDTTGAVIFMGKTNGTNWMNQDQVRTETIFNTRLNEWHHYVLVYENDYEEDGSFDYSYVTMYIDGVRVRRIEQYQGAGLTKGFGQGAANSGTGYNVGGYREESVDENNETINVVKRGLTGALDELRIYKGVLSATEVKALYDAAPVSSAYDVSDPSNDPDSLTSQEPGTDDPGTDNPGTDNPGTEDPGSEEPSGGCSSAVGLISAGSITIVALGVALVAIFRKRERG